MNEEKPKLIVAPKKWMHAILLIGAFASLIPVYFLSGHFFKETHFQILNGGVVGLFFLFSMICFYYFFQNPTLYFFKRRMQRRTFFEFFKKDIYYKNIEKWTEIEKENKYLKWLDLTVYTNEEKFTISSSNYPEWQYDSIKERLTSGKKRDRQEEKNWQRRNTLYFVFGFSTIAFLMLIWAYNIEQTKKNGLEYSELGSFSGVISNEVKIKERDKKNGKRYSIELKLQKYPDLLFDIDNYSYRAANVGGIVKNIQKNDTVFLSVSEEDYLKKITKETPLDFWDKHFYSSTIEVYELRFKGRSYLELRKYNSSRQTETSIPIIGFALFLLGASFYMYLFE